MRKEKIKITHFRNSFIWLKAFSFQNHKPQINTAPENLKRPWVCPQFQVNDDDSSCEFIYQASGQVHSRPRRWGHNSALESIHSFLHHCSGCGDYGITDMSCTSYGFHSVAQVSGSSVIWRRRAYRGLPRESWTHSTKVELTERLIDLSDGLSQQHKLYMD